MSDRLPTSTHRRNRNSFFCQREFGISMLEFAMTLPVLLFTVLAALDVTAVLQARTALQQATTTSLRCVYPVDGACVSTQGDTRERLFDYYRIPPGANDGYIIGRDDFAGYARFFHAPRRELTDFRAPRLGSVFFDIPRARYQVSGRIQGYRVLQSYRVLTWQATRPFVSGDSARTPDFSIRDANGASYPEAPSSVNPLAARISPLVARSGSGTTVSLGAGQASTNWQTAYSFTISRPELRALCEESDEVGSDCGLLTGDSTSVVFHLKGNAASSGPDGCGNVELRMWSTNSNVGLTGQRFEIHGTAYSTGAQQANFYPRGLLQEDVAHNLQDEGEFNNTRLSVEFGQQYQIQVRLSRVVDSECSSAPQISWHATSVDFYVPLFQRLEDREAQCAGLLPSTAVPTDFQCVLSPNILPAYLVGTPHTNSTPEQPTDVNAESGPAVSPHHAKHLILSQYFGVNLSPAISATFPLNVNHIQDESPAQFSQSCPENTGVNEIAEFSPGQTPPLAITASASASSQCPVQADALSDVAALLPFNPLITHIRWSETAALPIAHAPIPWTKSDCTVQPPDYGSLPSELQRYPQTKLTWSERAASEGPAFEIVLTGRESAGNPTQDPNDPLVLKQNDPRYMCPELEVGTYAYDDSNRSIDRSSLFVGVHDNIDACNRGEILREAAESSDVPATIRLLPEMFFSPGTPRRRDRIEVDSPPDNPCVTFQVRDSQSQGFGEKIAGGPFPESNTPSECTTRGACRRIFSGFGEGSMGETVIRTELAERMGREELFAAVPWTARLCESSPGHTSTCGSVSINEDSPLPGMVSSTAQTKVRLATLFGREITLSHTHQERLETELLK